MTASDDPGELAPRLQFAAAIAAAAGRRLLALRASRQWADARQLGDVGDHAADGFLQGALFGRFAAEAVLSEETAASPGRLDQRLVWIVDPLDGTAEYRDGRHDWAVHVGLSIDGRPALGAVALPAIDRVLAASGAVAAVTGTEGGWPTGLAADSGPPAGRPLRLAVSRSHTPDLIRWLATELGGAELVPCGSVGFKVAMLLFGRADAYVHRPGLKEWDTCAPEAVARAAGFVVSRFDGSDHRYNQADPRNNELVVCRPWLRDRVLAALRRMPAG